MDQQRIPKQGEIYNHFKDKPYQIITVATHTETGELMVVYQALYGDFKTYVRPLTMFMSEVDKEKYPEVSQKNRFELRRTQENTTESEKDLHSIRDKQGLETTGKSDTELPSNSGDGEEEVNALLISFLDAGSYNKKLEVLTSNINHMNDRLINDMAVALDCAIDEGPLDQRIQGLINCLQAMCRFEDRRLR